MYFSDLILTLSKLNEELHEQSLRAVNTSLTIRNWFFGFYIVEFEQNGSDRAGYGKTLLVYISIEMKSRDIPNIDERELRRYRQFYIAYPAAASIFAGNAQIRGLLPPELHIPDSHYFNLFTRISYTHFAELIRLNEPLKRLFYELECLKGSWSIKELKRQIIYCNSCWNWVKVSVLKHAKNALS